MIFCIFSTIFFYARGTDWTQHMRKRRARRSERPAAVAAVAAAREADEEELDSGPEHAPVSDAESERESEPGSEPESEADAEARESEGELEGEARQGEVESGEESSGGGGGSDEDSYNEEDEVVTVVRGVSRDRSESPSGDESSSSSSSSSGEESAGDGGASSSDEESVTEQVPVATQVRRAESVGASSSSEEGDDESSSGDEQSSSDEEPVPTQAKPAENANASLISEDESDSEEEPVPTQAKPVQAPNTTSDDESSSEKSSSEEEAAPTRTKTVDSSESSSSSSSEDEVLPTQIIPTEPSDSSSSSDEELSDAPLEVNGTVTPKQTTHESDSNSDSDDTNDLVTISSLPSSNTTAHTEEQFFDSSMYDTDTSSNNENPPRPRRNRTRIRASRLPKGSLSDAPEFQPLTDEDIAEYFSRQQGHEGQAFESRADKNVPLIFTATDTMGAIEQEFRHNLAAHLYSAHLSKAKHIEKFPPKWTSWPFRPDLEDGPEDVLPIDEDDHRDMAVRPHLAQKFGWKDSNNQNVEYLTTKTNEAPIIDTSNMFTLPSTINRRKRRRMNEQTDPFDVARGHIDTLRTQNLSTKPTKKKSVGLITIHSEESDSEKESKDTGVLLPNLHDVTQAGPSVESVHTEDDFISLRKSWGRKFIDYTHPTNPTTLYTDPDNPQGLPYERVSAGTSQLPKNMWRYKISDSLRAHDDEFLQYKYDENGDARTSQLNPEIGMPRDAISPVLEKRLAHSRQMLLYELNSLFQRQVYDRIQVENMTQRDKVRQHNQEVDELQKSVDGKEEGELDLEYLRHINIVPRVSSDDSAENFDGDSDDGSPMLPLQSREKMLDLIDSVLIQIGYQAHITGAPLRENWISWADVLAKSGAGTLGKAYERCHDLFYRTLPDPRAAADRSFFDPETGELVGTKEVSKIRQEIAKLAKQKDEPMGNPDEESDVELPVDSSGNPAFGLDEYIFPPDETRQGLQREVNADGTLGPHVIHGTITMQQIVALNSGDTLIDTGAHFGNSETPLNQYKSVLSNASALMGTGALRTPFDCGVGGGGNGPGRMIGAGTGNPLGVSVAPSLNKGAPAMKDDLLAAYGLGEEFFKSAPKTAAQAPREQNAPALPSRESVAEHSALFSEAAERSLTRENILKNLRKRHVLKELDPDLARQLRRITPMANPAAFARAVYRDVPAGTAAAAVEQLARRKRKRGANSSGDENGDADDEEEEEEVEYPPDWVVNYQLKNTSKRPLAGWTATASNVVALRVLKKLQSTDDNNAEESDSEGDEEKEEEEESETEDEPEEDGEERKPDIRDILRERFQYGRIIPAIHGMYHIRGFEPGWNRDLAEWYEKTYNTVPTHKGYRITEQRTVPDFELLMDPESDGETASEGSCDHAATTNNTPKPEAVVEKPRKGRIPKGGPKPSTSIGADGRKIYKVADALADRKHFSRALFHVNRNSKRKHPHTTAFVERYPNAIFALEGPDIPGMPNPVTTHRDFVLSNQENLGLTVPFHVFESEASQEESDSSDSDDSSNSSSSSSESDSDSDMSLETDSE